VPFGISDDIPHFAKRVAVSTSDQNIGRALDESLDYSDNLSSRFAGAEYHFGKALACGARVVHASVSDILIMKIPDSPGRLGGFETVVLVQL
jgi:hypothetical protein